MQSCSRLSVNNRDLSQIINVHDIENLVIGATSMTVPQTSDINYDGSRDYFDVFSFLDSFNAREPVADWNDDGIWDWWDVTRFVSDFAAE